MARPSAEALVPVMLDVDELEQGAARAVTGSELDKLRQEVLHLRAQLVARGVNVT
jgi:hypothetical protein